MVRLSEYVINFLANEGVGHIFMVSGGGGMYLIDSLGRSKRIKYVCNHHEQACAMSAEGYQRITGNLGVALVTTGPAGTNVITGLMCSWNDSIPVVIISGQTNSKSLIGDTGLRQRGTHEVNIVKIVESVTKYAVIVLDPAKIRYHLEKAVFLARSGRPGPVWLDIPLDVQSAMVDETNLEPFYPDKEGYAISLVPDKRVFAQVLQLIEDSKRPIIIAGHGIRLSGMQSDFLRLVESSQIPVVTTKLGLDLIHDSSDYLAGRIGTYGQRAGNIAVQNADLVLALGTRLTFTTTGYQTNMFAPRAKKIIVDIDPIQLKNLAIKTDLAVNMDLKDFIPRLISEISGIKLQTKSWVRNCQDWRKKYPVVLPEWKKQKRYVNPYYFFETLSAVMTAKDILVTDQGATFYCSTPAFKVKKNQRVFTNGGFSPMGYGLPAAIGACFANKTKRVVCAHGDGGLQMNIQELQTIVQYKLPIKLFVFSNQGYLSIKHTQNAYFNGFFVGSDPKSGVSCPDILKIARAYGISAIRIKNHSQMEPYIRAALNKKGPVIIDVVLDPLQPFIPRVSSQKQPDGTFISKSLEDMYPYLSREELEANIL